MCIQRIEALSERAVLVYYGDTINEQTHNEIQQTYQYLQHSPIAGVEEIICGYTNICMYYEPLVVKPLVQKFDGDSISQKFIHYLYSILTALQPEQTSSANVVEIPVVYGGEFGPDLQDVAEANGLTPQEVVDIHTSGDYLVYMLGFAPGFPFLGGLDKRIATPRRQTPRLSIAAGSVGIAGEQTGVYPLSTPGGWQIIGRTTLDLFLPHETPPTLLRAGDRVKFVAVEVHV